MPTTPFFGFPYPAAGDPNDIPGDLQAFAETVDSALSFLEGLSRPRHMAQVLGSVTNTIPGTATQGTVTWQTTDFNTSWPEPYSTDPAIVPFTDAATTGIQVNHPGFWFIFASIQARTVAPAANIDELALELLLNGSATPPISRSGSHDVTNTAQDSTFLLDASSGLLLAAGDIIGVRAQVRRSSGTSAVSFGRRSLTLLRMTQS